jgi:MFS family permease
MSSGTEAAASPGGAARRSVALFLAARLASGAAMQIQAVAIGWHIYELTGSALDLGFVGLAQFLPTVALALIAGHVIDLLPRRLVVAAALLTQCLCAAGLAFVSLLAQPPIFVIYLLVAGYGAARAFDHPGMASLLPTLVPRPHFPRAVAWSASVSQMATIGGPAVGGLLVAVDATVAFAAAAALLLGGAASVASVHEGGAPAAREPLSWSRLFGGVEFIRRDEALLGAISLDMIGVLFGGATALLPIYAQDILDVGPAGLGLLRTAPAVGALATASFLAWRPPRRQAGRTMLAAVGLFGLATLVFGLSRDLGLSLAALVVIGAADNVSVVIRQTLVQIETPDALRGRVSAVNALFVGTSNQLGEFESGLAAAWLGPVAAVALGGIVTVAVAALWGWRFPALRRLSWRAPERPGG